MKKICLLMSLLCILALAASCAAEQPQDASSSESVSEAVSSETVSETVSSEPEESSVTEEPEMPPLTMTQVSTVTDNFLNDAAFADFLENSEKYAYIPGLQEGIVPQGIACNPKTGYVYISAYFTTEDTPSVILVLDETGTFVAEYHMYRENGKPYTGHMGGICATENYLYFSGPTAEGGYYGIGELAFADLPTKGAHDITIQSVVPLPIHASYLFYDSGKLWAGTFYLKGSYDTGKYFDALLPNGDGGVYGGYAAMFEVDGDSRLVPADGEPYAVPELILSTPDKVQGFAYRDGKIALSISYGRNNNSKLDFFEINPKDAADTVTADGKTYPLITLNSKNRTKAVTAMGMTEGLALSGQGDLLILFESGAQKYSNAKNPTDSIWKFPIE